MRNHLANDVSVARGSIVVVWGRASSDAASAHGHDTHDVLIVVCALGVCLRALLQCCM